MAGFGYEVGSGVGLGCWRRLLAAVADAGAPPIAIETGLRFRRDGVCAARSSACPVSMPIAIPIAIPIPIPIPIAIPIPITIPMIVLFTASRAIAGAPTARLLRRSAGLPLERLGGGGEPVPVPRAVGSRQSHLRQLHPALAAGGLRRPWRPDRPRCGAAAARRHAVPGSGRVRRRRRLRHAARHRRRAVHDRGDGRAPAGHCAARRAAYRLDRAGAALVRCR